MCLAEGRVDKELIERARKTLDLIFCNTLFDENDGLLEQLQTIEETSPCMVLGPRGYQLYTGLLEFQKELCRMGEVRCAGVVNLIIKELFFPDAVWDDKILYPNVATKG
jgi:hypothetical protein